MALFYYLTDKFLLTFSTAKDHMSSNSTKFTSSSDLPRVNHKMLKSCQSSAPTASNWQVTANIYGLKEH